MDSSEIFFLFLFVNAVLLAFSYFFHAALTDAAQADTFALLDNAGIWLLILFKVTGANIILWQIVSEFTPNTHSS